MPLLSHSQSLGLQLQTWDQAMRQDLRWKLILRNFDRECDRGDIDPRKLDDFLRKLEVEWQTLSPAGARGPTNPAAAIDNAISGARKFFLLPGKPLASPVEATKLYRYVRLDKFWKYNLQGLAISGQSNSLARLINSTSRPNVTSADITGAIGASDQPGWCTDDASWTSSTANRIRDRIGLRHIESDWLLEVSYTFGVLQAQSTPVELQAPTVIDGCAGGAENWIFCKRQALGGPDWGCTVDMDGGGACNPGSTEAVHQSFSVPRRMTADVALKAAGEITATCPQIDYDALYKNALL